MAAQKGTFIVIEGSDGSGKGTQYELLVARLRRKGYEVATFDFPQYAEPSSFFVREYLNGKYGTAEQVGPYTAALFYALDRYQVAPQIKQAIAEGKVVIANRFTASSMAHQGTKFANAEERRGYYIWLDNLESVMLQIPRPNRSVVLRVPADTAQNLIDKKELRSYTDKKRDLHEADINHLRQAVRIYDELCQIFPKDFRAIDCVRDDKLLQPEVISDIVWATIEPMLPSVIRKKLPESINQQKTTPQEIITAGINEKPDTEKLPVPVLAAVKSGIISDIPDPIRYFTPGNLPPKINGSYRDTMAEILKLHTTITTGLAEYIEQTEQRALPEALAKARKITETTLPMATLTSIDSGLSLQQDVVTLITSKATADPLAKLAHAFLPENHAPLTTKPKLITAWPRNELELLPQALYPYANTTVDVIRETIADWPITRKQDALLKYVENHQKDSANVLRSVSYTWDLLCDYATIGQMLHVGCVVVSQEFTPRSGYDLPRILEEADLSDQFERCFDLSLHIHSTLHAAGFPTEAQYVTLLGHRQRYEVTTSAMQLAALSKVQSDVVRAIRAKAAELHPLLFAE
jgi:dTMP kinase